ncbi:MAG: ABC transporter substrate-binding protein, partial [Candidatus Phosphoribacter sp.]
WTVVGAVNADRVVPVPPNAVAMLSAHGLDGDAVPVSGAPVALAYGAGSVWALDATRNLVLRIDPDTRRVHETIPDVGGSPQSIAVDGHDVWIAGFDEGVVTRVNTETNTVVTKIRVGIQPAAVVAREGRVWVANSGDNTVQLIDPVTSRAGQPIGVGTGPAGLALEGATLWVSNSRGATVTTLDTTTGERLVADVAVGAGPRGIWATASDVWVANELGQSVTRIARDTGQVTTIAVEDGPSAIVVLDAFVWVSNAFSGSVSRIDTATLSVRRIALDSAPRALAVVDGQAWVSTGAFGAGDHVGGTLVYTTAPGELGPTLDPASAYMPSVYPLLRPVYDGLVTLGATGGLASQTLVPDLATSIPTPSDGGRTYVFTIRSGIRYSTGQEVVASDFVRGVRRALLGEGNPGLYGGIVGAQDCIGAPDRALPVDPGRCTLSAGVSADDATRRLTIRLSQPDPDFLYKLTYLVTPVPPGTPLTDTKMSATIPGTGPYQLSDVAADGSITLTSNPHFRQWSHAAQPAGYPEQIRYRVAASAEQGHADVIAGSADVAGIYDPSQFASLAGHAQLVWRFALPAMDWFYINSRIPPFDDLRARQAINYAVDRRAFVSLRGGADAADLSCQLLPPGFPAYRSYCPYQTGTHSGDYLGPDLARARELVRESGTAQVPITVWAFQGRGHSVKLYDGFPEIMASTLRSIGYSNVAVQVIPDEHVGTAPNNPVYDSYQMFTQFGWIADYPGPQTFYDQFSCSQPHLSRYCNPAIEAVAAEAAANAQVDPGRSLELWNKVDRMLTDDGAFVTLGQRHAAVLVSPRVRNVQLSPVTGPVLSQMWVN